MKQFKRKNILSLFNRLVFVLNLLAVFVLLLSYISNWISPEKLWPVAYFGLGYPVLFFINLLFTGYWLIQRKRKFLYSFVAILLGIGFIGRYVQLNDKIPEKDLDNYFKVLSYNVHSYARREWKEGEHKKFTDQFIKFFDNQNPDILCLQEHLAYGETERKIRKMIRKKSGLSHYYLKKYHNTYDKSQTIGIFTHYPIICYEMEQMDWRGQERTFFIFADLKIKKDTVRVYNTHLQSIHLNKEQVSLTKSPIRETLNNEEIKQSSLKMLRKLKYAFQERAKQVDKLDEHINKCSHPVIVCGDFNDTPTSYAYQQIADDLTDTYKEAGMGKSKTYTGEFPAFRIDYIFHDPKMEAANMESIKKPWSDHYPLVSYLKIKD